MKHHINILVVILCLIISFDIYANNQFGHEIYEHDALSKIAASLKSVRSATDRKEALKILNRNLGALEKYSLQEIRRSRSYEALGSLYMYYGFLMSDEANKNDEAIKAFNKALSIRVEPTSHKELAEIYKKKYDEAVEANNILEESIYGEKTYEHIKQYMRLANVTSEKWKEIRDFFEAYALENSRQTKSKK